jgi:hypothetical protein
MNEEKRPGDLIDRQSVRTTFRLSEEALEALGWLSKRYALSMKDLIDYAIIRQVTLLEFLNKPEDSAHGVENKEILPKIKTVRRTLVVTKKTLKNLELLSKELNRSRDDIVNKAIIEQKERTESSDIDEIGSCREVLAIINNLIDDAKDSELQVSKLLEYIDTDDDIVGRIRMVINDLKDAYINMMNEIRIREKLV